MLLLFIKKCEKSKKLNFEVCKKIFFSGFFVIFKFFYQSFYDKMSKFNKINTRVKNSKKMLFYVFFVKKTYINYLVYLII